ncbi:MAG: HAMP domain-containing histidine kinase [Christensenellaceae bacterium]|jgi:signal transduction histidine kinase|nr:HAMP domain-containing histidine kinase [Christensenellaceae bacterium]
MLNTFYRTIKTSDVQQNTDTITSIIDNPELDSYIEVMSYREDMSIVIISDTGAVIHKYLRQPSILGALSDSEYLSYYNEAKSNDGSYLYFIQSDSLAVNGLNDSSLSTEVGVENLIYAKIIKNSANEELAIITESSVTPMPSLFSVAVVTALVISCGIVFLTLTITIFLTKKVAKPIESLTTSAMDMASGDADVVFKGDGFKEVIALTDALNYASKQISVVEHLRRELLANVSHDLRTPLTLMKGYTEMMLDIPEEVTPENLQIIVDETERLTNLVNDMLDLSRMQSGDLVLNFTTFDIIALLNEIVKRHSALLSRMGYSIKLESDDSLWVYADELKISQVIYNLLSNAINYVGEDKLVIVRAITRDNNVRIEVIDHGIGIDVDKISHIWDRYYKSDNNHIRGVVGTGLGLSIVKNVMTLHPGAIYGVDSSIGAGSKFYIELPIAKGDENDEIYE